MTSACPFCGRPPMVGNNVSHSNQKTKRVFKLNANKGLITSECLGRSISVEQCGSCRKTIFRDGFDTWISKNTNFNIVMKHGKKGLKQFAEQARQCVMRRDGYE